MRTLSTSFSGDGRARRLTSVARIARILDYAFGVLYAMLGIRLALAFIDARHTAAFTRFVDDVTNFFYWPFQGIVASDRIAGQVVVWPLVICIAAYVLLHAGIKGLLRLIARG